MTPAQPTPTPRPWHHTLWVCLLLAAVTLAVYWPVTGYEFVNYDDTDFIANNPTVQAGITAPGLHYALTAEIARNWHPLTVISHMLDCQIFDLHAGGHHRTSLLFHIANSVLIFLVLRRMTAAFWRSALVAALFAWHPLHVESVAWIAERKDVLSAFFWWLTLWAWLGWAGPGKFPASKSKLFYFLSIILFACAAMSKPMVVTFPFVLLLLDYWPLGRLKLRAPPPPPVSQARAKSRPRPPSVKLAANNIPIWRLLLEKIPFFAISAALCWKTFLVQQTGGAMMDTSNLPFASRIANVFVSYVRYPAKMFWPADLSALYIRIGGWRPWQVAGAEILLASLTVWILFQAGKRPWLAMGWFWYLGMLVPVIGLVQVGMQSLADRYTYLPMIGLFIILAWGGAELAARFRPPKHVPALAAGLSLIACLLVTAHQIPVWQNSESLFTKMIAVNNDNFMAHYNLGNLYTRQKKFDLAATNYLQAIAAEPIYADAHKNLAGMLLEQQKFDEAIYHYQEAARLEHSPTAFFNLANTFADAARGRHDTNFFDKAVSAYRESLQRDPAFYPAHHNLGKVWEDQGRDDLAIAEFQTAVSEKPDFELGHFNLANAFARAKRVDDAIAQFRAATNLNPTRAESYNGLALCYLKQDKWDQAAQQFSNVIKLAPRDPGVYDNLGNILGTEGKYDDAIAAFLKALQLNPGDFQAEFNIGLSCLRLNRRDDARTHFQAALCLQPGYTPALQALSALDQPPK